jgi:hypothetical protein
VGAEGLISDLSGQGSLFSRRHYTPPAQRTLIFFAEVVQARARAGGPPRGSPSWALRTLVRSRRVACGFYHSFRWRSPGSLFANWRMP